ncbi:MAG TPA: hypothetical protein VM100_07480 [Longimicrobiales bacterium]|nr:hypothetical protein [Longimicrobiales bacterium]
MREDHVDITRQARVWTIGDPQNASECWIVCHGYGQLAREFITDFEKIAAPHRCIIAPEGLHRFYIDQPPAPANTRRVAATWMTREDRKTDIEDYVAYLDRAYDKYVVSGAKVRVLGFSQGAATVLRWAVLGGQRIDQLILWAGEVPPDLPPLNKPDQHVPHLLYVRGTRDQYLSDDVLQQHLRKLKSWGCQLVEFDGGHRLDDHTLAQIADTAVP